MLTQVDVNSENAFIVPIATAKPKDSIILQKITGLTPPDGSLFIGDYSRDGGTYQGRRIGTRNPVFMIDLNPNPALGETVSGLREMLYKAFMSPTDGGEGLTIVLHLDDGREVYFVGYTEKFEGEVMDVETALQISMICPDPYLRDVNETVLTDVAGWTTVPFAYAGTADVGFSVSMTITGATSKLTLDNNGSKMIINRTFLVGDVVNISTVNGARKLTVISGTDPESSILGTLAPGSPWLQLHAQANVMKVYGNTTANLVAAIHELRYTQTYWGI